jgi:ABC-type lipoprotein release transport system permease subunit
LGVGAGVLVVAAMNRVGIELPAPGAKIASIIHPTVEPSFLVRTLLQASLGATVAAIIPARRAAQLRPVEALAHT